MFDDTLAAALPDSPTSARLRHHLRLLLPAIAQHLQSPAAWEGIQVSAPDADTDGFLYERLVARENLASSAHTYLVGAHAFSGPPRQGALHDHIYPLAVYVFAEGQPLGTPLYDMPWQDRRPGGRTGQVTVHAGQGYALAPCTDLLHAVHSRRPHLSVTLADLSEPPARPNRLRITPLSVPRTLALCLQIGQALEATLSR